MRRTLFRLFSSPFDSVKQQLQSQFQPAFLHLDGGNEHDGLHCRLTIVAGAFEGKTLVQRHREVMKVFSGSFEQGLHALSIVAKTPGEWEKEKHRNS